MAFPETGVLDSFDRANGTLNGSTMSGGGTWDAAQILSANDYTIASNVAVPPSVDERVGVYSSASYDRSVGLVEVHTTFTTASDNFFGVMFGAVSTGSFYAFRMENVTPTWQLFRYDSGTPTTLASGSQAISSGQKLGASHDSTGKIRLYYTVAGTWTLLDDTITDTTHAASGRIGLFASAAGGSGITFNDWGGGQFASGVTGTMASTMQSPVASLTGAQIYSGSMTSAMQSALFNGTGAQPFTAVLTSAMQAAVASLTGVMQPSGVVTAAMQSAVFSGSGSVADFVGSITSAMQRALFNATGVMHPSGVLTATLQTALAALTGAQTQAGTITAAMQEPTTALTGVMQPEGTLTAGMQEPLFAGTGTAGLVTGTMAAAIQVALFNATGVMHPSGAIVSVLQVATFAGQGEQPHEGTMAAALQMLLFVALGETELFATKGDSVFPINPGFISVASYGRVNFALRPVSFSPPRVKRNLP